MYNGESTNVDVIPLFHSSKNDYWFSFVDFEKIKVNKFVKLTPTALCRWFDLPPIDMRHMKQWQDKNRILFRFVKLDVTKERRWQQRSGYPNYEPAWIPKITFNLGIDDQDYVYLYDRKESVKCGKNKCLFKTWRSDKIDRHRGQCSDTTQIKTMQTFYGKPDTKYDHMTIPKVFFDNPEFKFAVFDLETVETKSDVAEAKLKLLSIGLYSNIDNQEYYFERKSSSIEDGQKMVNQFLEKLQELADLYQSSLPPQIQSEIIRLKEKFTFYFYVLLLTHK